MFSNVHTFACLPTTSRGQPLVLGGDPKGKTFLYPHGNSIVIRDIENPSICDIYSEHSAPTTVAKYSPSGFYIASADNRGNVRIWDTTQKEHILKNEFQPFGGIVKDLAWSADSQRIVAVGEGREKFGHVFSMDTGTSIGEIAGHSKAINSCDFKPTRPFKIITGSEDTCVGIFEGPPFKFKSQLQEHNRYVQAVRFSPNGDYFASGGFDGKFFIFNSSDYTKVFELGNPAHKGGIYAIAWSPDSKQILSASGDKTCKLWDATSGALVTEFNLGNDVLDQQVSCLWQEPYLLSVSLSGFINYLDRNEPNKPLRVIKGHNKSITALTVSNNQETNDDATIFTGSHDGYITYWSSKTGTHDRVTGTHHTNQVQDMCITGNLLHTCGLDDTIRAIDLKSKQYIDSAMQKLQSQPKGLASANNSDILVIGCLNELIIYEGKEKKSETKLGFEAGCVDLHPDKNQVAVGHGPKVHIFSIQNFQLTETKLWTQKGNVTSVKYSPDGKYLATSDDNRKVWLYNASTYELAHNTEWGFHLAKVNCLSWSPDSRLLASGGLDTNLIVWSPVKPDKHTIIKHAHPTGQITKVSFIDNQTIVSVGQDATVRVWSVSQL